MKKKILIAFLLVLTVLFSVKTTKVLAENGPYPGSAGMAFYNPENDNETIIFSAGTVYNDAFAGATYDKDTNTLTLDNVKTTLSLEYAGMGDDFKINLVGDNEIGYLSSYSYGYGSNINFVGNGSLTINKDKKWESGIYFSSSGVKGKIEVADTATLKVYGSNFAIGVVYSKESDGSKVFVLKNGQDISDSIKSKEITMQSPKTFEGILLVPNYGDYVDNYTLATKNGKKYAVSGNSSYYVQNQVVLYHEASETYFMDPTSSTGAFNERYDSLEELQAAGYTLTDTQITISHFTSLYGSTAADQTGKEYAYYTTNYNGTQLYYVCDITNDTVTLSDGKQYVLAIYNKDIDFNSLTPTVETISEGYEHILDLKELEVLPGSNDNSSSAKEVVKADDNKSDNDKAAAGAVNELLAAALDGKSITGMSNTLIVAITEAIENGDEVSVELETSELEEKNVTDEVKNSVEEKIKNDDTLKDAKVLGYFDINLLVKVNDDTLDEKVTELNKEIEVKVDVSELVKKLDKVASNKVRKYYVIRIHDGKTDVIEATLNDDNTLSFKTDRFSSYTVTYKDIDTPSNPKTLDNISTYITLGFVSLISLLGVSINLKKRTN